VPASLPKRSGIGLPADERRRHRRAAGVCATTDRSAAPRRRNTQPWRIGRSPVFLRLGGLDLGLPPTVPLPNGAWFALSECNAPGSIIVNSSGERYMIEALPYVEATHRMYGGTHGQGPGPGENLPSWMILN
jgi:hypothetical protein